MRRLTHTLIVAALIASVSLGTIAGSPGVVFAQASPEVCLEKQEAFRVVAAEYAIAKKEEIRLTQEIADLKQRLAANVDNRSITQKFTDFITGSTDSGTKLAQDVTRLESRLAAVRAKLPTLERTMEELIFDYREYCLTADALSTGEPLDSLTCPQVELRLKNLGYVYGNRLDMYLVNRDRAMLESAKAKLCREREETGGTKRMDTKTMLGLMSLFGIDRETLSKYLIGQGSSPFTLGDGANRSAPRAATPATNPSPTAVPSPAPIPAKPVPAPAVIEPKPAAANCDDLVYDRMAWLECQRSGSQ